MALTRNCCGWPSSLLYRDRKGLQRKKRIIEIGKNYIDKKGFERNVRVTEKGKDYRERKGIQR